MLVDSFRNRSRVARLLSALLFTVTFVSADSLAQRTGASVGGSHFGGGSSSSGSSWGGSSSSGSSWGGSSSSGSSWGGSSSSGSSWGSSSSDYSSPSYDSSPSSYNRRQYGSRRSRAYRRTQDPPFLRSPDAMGVAATVVALLFILWLFWSVISGVRTYRRAEAYEGQPFAGSAPSNIVHTPVTRRAYLSKLSIAFDARQRAFLQQRLLELANRADTSTAAGLLHLLRDIALCLQSTRRSAVGVSRLETSALRQNQIEGRFRESCADFRARYRQEVFRKEGGGMYGDAFAARSGGETSVGVEGGFVVVSIIAATQINMGSVYNASPRDAVYESLQRIITLPPGKLVAMEVIWSPAEESDHMDSAEMVAIYPEIELFPMVQAGRLFCGHCGGPFAGELPRCPHCGAPTPPRDVSATRSS